MYDVGSPAARRLRRPRWFDVRLLVGVLLVLGSVVVGAKVVASADSTVPVWAAAHDLAPGTRLSDDDVTAARVKVAHAGAYLAASRPKPLGRLLTRPVGRDELLPASALAVPAATADMRQVTVPVRRNHFPKDLRQGDVVDVYATPTKATDAAAAAPALLLHDVSVDQGAAGGGDVFGAGGGGDTTPVVLLVRTTEVDALVGALESAQVDLVRVPDPMGAGAADTSAAGGASARSGGASATAGGSASTQPAVRP